MHRFSHAEVTHMTLRALAGAAVFLTLGVGAPHVVHGQATDATYKARREQLAKELEATEKALADAKGQRAQLQARVESLIAQAMQEHGCKSFVFSSTCATYGVPESIPISESNPQNPINPYGRSKLMLEWVLADCDRAWGLKSACHRYFNASGCSEDGLIGEDHNPETHLIPRVLMAVTGEITHVDVFGTDYPTPDGTGVRDYIHVADLASAHAKAIDHLTAGGDSVRCNLGTGVGVSVNEIISAVEEVTGKKVPVQYGPRRAGDPPQLLADPRLAKEVLGWVAEHRDVRDMVRSAWAWMDGPRKGRFTS